MKFFSIDGNSQRLDGGAMFGNAPRALWSRWIAPDEQNRIPLACRALLVEEESGRRVLLEAGIGAFFEPKLRDRFGVVEERHVLLDNLAAAGVRPEDVDVIVLSHLHFDHAGGLLQPWARDKAPALAFPRARYVVSEPAWTRALEPHARDRASFIPELQPLLREAGVEVVPAASTASQTLGAHYSFFYSDGHTPGLMLTRVESPGRGAITFLGDLAPGMAWVHLPITMGYDRYPELLIGEKRALFDGIIDRGEWVFYTHDPHVAASRLDRDPHGKYVTREPVAELRWE
ncbi:MBL fold metallo-hydrolase [Pendulispora albinea]|uniref:MBL fold metallo-hydrolase n=1 Tax=Pendulispora albinea TaxID=2741071 RepID=A0ABZ2M4V6_9BACT